MVTLRQTALTSTDSACRFVDRQRVAHETTFVMRRARLEVQNDPRTKDQSSLVRCIVGSGSNNCRSHVDVGENLGRSSNSALDAARQVTRIYLPDLRSSALLMVAPEGRPVRRNNRASNRIGLACA